MDIYLARQPILNRNNQVVAYEVLYRDGKLNVCTERDAEYATGNALTRCFVDFGINQFTGGKKAFVNFTDLFLKSNLATIFPSDCLAIEILESVCIDRQIIERCAELKKKGYQIAIDDFAYRDGYDELVPLVDIIKIDFQTTTAAERMAVINRYKRPGLQFLAEKVETQQQHQTAYREGYDLFQGYFYAKPELSRRRRVAPLNVNLLRLVNLISSNEPDFEQIIRLIESDLSFAYSIVRIANSVYYGRLDRISSLRQAVVTIGLEDLRKWLYLAYISNLRADKPDEIVTCSLLRGKFMESLARISGNGGLAPKALTIGMFSMLDAVCNQPMEKALEDLRFTDDIKRVLLGEKTDSLPAEYYHLVLDYEHGQWGEISNMAAHMGIPISRLNRAYLESIRWLNFFLTV